MDGGRFSKQLLFGNNYDQDDSENSPENSAGSPPSALLPETTKIATSSATCSSNKQSRRRSVQKKVVSVPINEVDGSSLKGEITYPPSDSWAWRKYGQKPIKGSPYPRGYYRCSSSKGCPAKKQVERSRVDPNMLLVTYSCEHNHPWPAAAAARSHRYTAAMTGILTHQTRSKLVVTSATAAASDSDDGKEAVSDFSTQLEVQSDHHHDKFTHIGGDGGGEGEEFGWFSGFEAATSAVTEEDSVLTEGKVMSCTDMRPLVVSVGEEDSLFADLGELPECSREFELGMMERDEDRRRRSLTPWCPTA
ncbi:unnamed protein product [Cuscuta epithymum]|uniref:WRKY domain-containing protein n=1 Tax=Cuscuta epithymum TaxID=186058 RepID=A0AAV0CMV5_9ASTE|nr:unnamed protein product [Cuscuta epithymum]